MCFWAFTLLVLDTVDTEHQRHHFSVAISGIPGGCKVNTLLRIREHSCMYEPRINLTVSSPDGRTFTRLVLFFTPMTRYDAHGTHDAQGTSDARNARYPLCLPTHLFRQKPYQVYVCTLCYQNIAYTYRCTINIKTRMYNHVCEFSVLFSNAHLLAVRVHLDKTPRSATEKGLPDTR